MSAWQSCEFRWCAQCLQGVEFYRATTERGVYDFQPCGHRAAFHDSPPGGDPTMKHACIHCGKEADPTKVGTFREVTGWEEVRRGGGGHGLTSRKETGRVACGSCMDRIRRNLAPLQGSIL